MKKLNILFALLLCLFINEMSGQNLRYTLIGNATLRVYINGQLRVDVNNASPGYNNNQINMTPYLVHTDSPWDLIEIYASNEGRNRTLPVYLFAGEDGLPNYPIDDFPNFSYLNTEHTYAYYSSTWALGANDMYIEVQGGD